MFETSPTTSKLDAALAKAQGEIEAASKDKVNPHFNKRYADLASIWAAIRPALSKHGIAVTQWPIDSTDNRLHIVTRLAHDGEWIMAKFSVPVQKADVQGYGSAVTYARRYSLAAAVGSAPDDDDDGNAAVKHSPKLGVRDDTPRSQPDMAHINGTPGASKAVHREPFDKLVKELRQAATVPALKEWLKLRRNEIDALPEEWVANLESAYDDHKESLTAKVAA